MEARAQLSHARITPRKVKIVCDLIRGKDTKTAVAILMNTPNAAAELLLKLVNSAVANAENNHSMDPDNLYISETFANPGPILKRGMARARGGYARILKRTSHITVVVKEKE
ncbi:MAG: 50S ribosomal protein L22 [Clostridiales bacterium]|nr:50S ribosomal protein L22 [Clostridiales bacterium]